MTNVSKRGFMKRNCARWIGGNSIQKNLFRSKLKVSLFNGGVKMVLNKRRGAVVCGLL